MPLPLPYTTFDNISVDISSDLYSLCVVLWEMLTGQPPFQGSPADVMHKHLHAPLALKRLGTVPQPAVALLEALLEKDPARRFQTPSHGRWGSPVEEAVEGRSLTAEDQLLILMQAGHYLTATRGLAASEARICYERAESLCHSLNDPLALHAALMAQWHHSLNTDTLPATMQIAEGLYSLAKEQENAALMTGACSALGITLFFLGDFETAGCYLGQGLELWRSGGGPSSVEEVDLRAVSCLCYKADCDWHLGEIASSHATIVEAICLANELNNTHGLAEALAEALASAASLGHSERNPAEVERCASELMELATRHHFAHWRAVGAIYGGWARSASGDTAGGLAWIEDGLQHWRATGAVRVTPVWLTIKAEALHFAGHTCEALEAIKNAEALIGRTHEREWFAELHRLRGVFLATIGAEEAQIEASFGEAIRTAKQQKSISLTKRAEESYAEYRRQKRERLGHGLPPEPGKHCFWF